MRREEKNDTFMRFFSYQLIANLFNICLTFRLLFFNRSVHVLITDRKKVTGRMNVFVITAPVGLKLDNQFENNCTYGLTWPTHSWLTNGRSKGREIQW